MHKLIKAALYSEDEAGEFTTILGSRIYDVIADRGDAFPYCVWRMADVQIVNHGDNFERINCTVEIMLVTDYSKGVSAHLVLLDALASLRNYTAAGTSKLDRLTLRLASIGQVDHDEQTLTSSTRFAASSTRIA